MATFSRRERTTRTIEFIVPAAPPYGADWTDVMTAIRVAHIAMADHGLIVRRENGTVPDAADNQLRIAPGVDDRGDPVIVVSFTLDTVEHRSRTTEEQSR